MIMNQITFLKMHALGNDFVIIDKRKNELTPDENTIRHLADRREGIGCDQVILMEACTQTDIFVRIFNADASESGMCGNALRCIGMIVMEEKESNKCTIRLSSGDYTVIRAESDEYTVHMGKGSFDWKTIPLASKNMTAPLDYEIEQLGKPYALSIGNPHLVFWVDDINAYDIDKIGEFIQQDSLFPEGMNVEIAQILDPNTIFMCVWERGVGQTPACGSGACAVALASFKAGKTHRDVHVYMPGGVLKISITEQEEVMMTGPVMVTFFGSILLKNEAHVQN